LNGDPSSRYAGNLNFSFAYVEGNINDMDLMNVGDYDDVDDGNDDVYDDDDGYDGYMYLCINYHQNIL
jgi:hypothetical protein